MPGFSSISDFQTEVVTNGKFRTAEFTKANGTSSAGLAGAWWEWFTGTGAPAAGTFAGSAGVATQIDRTNAGALDIGGNVSTDLRYLLSATINTKLAAASNIASTYILCDFLLYYPSCSGSTDTALTNSVGLPRYTTGDGVMVIAAVQTALGSQQTNPVFTYTDNDGNTGQVSPAALTAPQVSCPTKLLFLYNNTPWMPFLNGDKGVRAVDSYATTSGNGGTFVIILVKPLIKISTADCTASAEKDFFRMEMPMPKIEDGACLAWIGMNGPTITSTSTINGSISLGWG